MTTFKSGDAVWVYSETDKRWLAGTALRKHRTNPNYWLVHVWERGKRWWMHDLDIAASHEGAPTRPPGRHTHDDASHWVPAGLGRLNQSWRSWRRIVAGDGLA